MERSTDDHRFAARVGMHHSKCFWRSFTVCPLLATLLVAGCRSDINQQLLERELRLQEDQIYRLQDELHQKCARLDREIVENSSLRRQLGMPEGTTNGQPARRLPARAAPASAGPGGLTPPKIEFVPPPSGIGTGNTLQPPSLKPPTGEGLPPAAISPTPQGASTLPSSPAPGATIDTGARTRSAAGADESDGPAFAPSPTTLPIEPAGRAASATPIRRLSYEESLADQDVIVRIVLNASRSGPFDADSDGRAEGLAVVFEPRDADERLVTAVGDVVLSAYDPMSASGAPIAVWEIPARQAVEHFRRSSRARGLHFVLNWPGEPPTGSTIRLKTRLTTFEGRSFEDEAVLSQITP
ncbi:MAG: hypothetical protein ACKOCN_05430 [Planctomycetaceae bacterium]